MHSSFKEFRDCVERLADREHEVVWRAKGLSWMAGPRPPWTVLRTYSGIGTLRRIWDQFGKSGILAINDPQRATRELEETIKEDLTADDITILTRAVCSCISLHGAECPSENSRTPGKMELLPEEADGSFEASDRSMTAKAQIRKDIPQVAGPRKSTRASIVRSVMTSGADFKDRNKVIELAQKLDAAGVKLPVRRSPPRSNWEPKTFLEVAQKPSTSEYRRIYDARKGVLVRDLTKR